MKQITVNNYKKDEYYPKVVNAVSTVLAKKNFVAPIDLFVEMGLLDKADLEAWRFGSIEYLERVLHGNLSKLNRILRILKLHAQSLNLKPSFTAYVRWGKKPRTRLRFSKNVDENLEIAYATHFVAMPTIEAQKREACVGKEVEEEVG
jgi:hypothetical protein